MKNIQPASVYMHQGVKLHPKLIYAVADEVADGLVALGLASASTVPADMELPQLTWDAATVRGAEVQPAPVVSPGG